jgi:gamma-butyrobetaine dioxygenase
MTIAVDPGFDILPPRVGRVDVAAARAAVERDGGVVLTGWPAEPDSLVVAAATVLGTRLRGLEKVQRRTTVDGGELDLHRDGAHVVVEIQDRQVRLRHPDIDYVLVLCHSPAAVGGDSVVVDGYRIAEHVRATDPQLYRFLTGVDVDLTTGIGRSDVHHVPRVARLLEHTRGGRLIVRVADGVQPVPRESEWDEHVELIARWDRVLDEARAAVTRSTRLGEGEILLLDNYRCLHGVTPHSGPRTTYVARATTADVW